MIRGPKTIKVVATLQILLQAVYPVMGYAQSWSGPPLKLGGVADAREGAPSVRQEGRAAPAKGASAVDQDGHKQVVLRSLADGFVKIGRSMSDPYSVHSSNVFADYAAGMASDYANQQATETMQRLGITARVSAGVDGHFAMHDAAGDFLIPLYDNHGKNLVFTQLGARRQDGRTTLNAGVGTRYFAGAWMYGLNAFFDYDVTGKNRRIGFGGELWTNYLKLAANGYYGLSGWHAAHDLVDYDERPANGYDVRANAYLPSFPWLGVKLVWEQYFGREVALFNSTDRERNPHTVTVGLNYTPIPLLTFGVDLRKGGRGQSDVRAGVQMRYELGRSLSSQLDPHNVSVMRSLSGSRYDLVERNNQIVLDYRKQDLIRLSVDRDVSGAAGQTVALHMNVTAKYGFANAQWSAPALVAAGGRVMGAGQQWAVVLPAYQVGGHNDYALTAVAYDAHGNASNQATVMAHVTGQDVSVVRTEVSLKPNEEPADGHSVAQMMVALRDAGGAPIVGRSGDFSVAVTDSPLKGGVLGGHLVKVGAAREVGGAPGTYQIALTAGMEPGRVRLTPKLGSVALHDVDLALDDVVHGLVKPADERVPYGTPPGYVSVKGGNGKQMEFKRVSGTSVRVEPVGGEPNRMKLTFAEVGESTIQVSQEGATPVTFKVVVEGQQVPLVKPADVSFPWGMPPAHLTVKGGNGQPMKFVSSLTEVASVRALSSSEMELTFKKVGESTVTVSQEGTTKPVTFKVTVTAGVAPLVNPGPQSLTYGTPVVVPVKGGTGGAMSFAVVHGGSVKVESASANEVKLTPQAIGETTVQVSQAGTKEPVYFNVNVVKRAGHLEPVSDLSVEVGADTQPKFAMEQGASWSFKSSNEAAVSAKNAHRLAYLAPGVATVTLSKDATATDEAVTATFKVTVGDHGRADALVKPADVSFPWGMPPAHLTVKGGNGQPMKFVSSLTEVASVRALSSSEMELTFKKVGESTVTVSQEGTTKPVTFKVTVTA
ncbi:inverse autotransporter beta domain-containing protein, partial [Burkholderia cenocepacia]|uniref:inverse autotransporter beta domain-containing protein n=1 Tax=Burkholderia cenocepacia TaxID=95486 RepID=UPI000F5A0953